MFYDTEMSPLVPKLSTVARMRPRSWWKLVLTLEVGNKNLLFFFVKNKLFSGKISVEGAEGRPGCEVRGERSSPETSHSFVIGHKDCGSHSNSSAVWTYVVVQENGSILTQSTRRWMLHIVSLW